MAKAANVPASPTITIRDRIIAALWFGVTGVLADVLYWHWRGYPLRRNDLLEIAFAAFVSGALVGSLLLKRAQTPTLFAAIAVSGAVALVGHCVYAPLYTLSCVDTPQQWAYAIPFFIVASSLFAGWLTFPLAAMAGAGLWYLAGRADI